MTEKISIAIASDLSGFPLKQAIVDHLKQRGDIELLDFGIDSVEHPKPYFEQAPKVAEVVQTQRVEKGILICGCLLYTSPSPRDRG